MSFQKTIDAILDTPKVEGLLVFDLEGEVYFEQMPQYTDQAMLQKLPQRILMMYDVIADNFQNCSDFILKFDKKNLYFRKSHRKEDMDFILAVLGDAGVNFVSLKLVTNLAMKMLKLEDKPTDEYQAPASPDLTYRGQKVSTASTLNKKSGRKKRSNLIYRGRKT